MDVRLVALALLGLLLSIYAAYVVSRRARSRSYRPWCDMSPRVSCTKAFMSPDGRLLRVHNAWLGVVGYLVLFILAARGRYDALIVFATAATLLSLYLAYVSYVEMRTFCAVCTTIHLVNALLVVLSCSIVF